MFVRANFLQEAKLVLLQCPRISRTPSIHVHAHELEDKAAIHKGEAALNENGHALVQLMRFDGQVTVPLNQVRNQHLKETFHAVQELFGKSLIPVHFNAIRAQQVLRHTFDDNVKENVRVPHEFVHQQKVRVVRTQKTRQELTQLPVNGRLIFLRLCRHAKHKLDIAANKLLAFRLLGHHVDQVDEQPDDVEANLVATGGHKENE